MERLYYGEMMNPQAVGAIVNRSAGTVRWCLLKRGRTLRTHKEAAALTNWPGRTGEKAGNWKGGERYNSQGYILLYMPDHPRAMRSGYLLRSHWIWECETGHIVQSDEVVHHRGARDDGGFEMLVLFESVGAHTVFHAQQRKAVKALRDAGNSWAEIQGELDLTPFEVAKFAKEVKEA